MSARQVIVSWLISPDSRGGGAKKIVGGLKGSEGRGRSPAQQVASVNGSIEIHGEQQVERLVWQHVASVKALLHNFSHASKLK